MGATDFIRVRDLLCRYDALGKIPAVLSPFDYQSMKEAAGKGSDYWYEFIDTFGSGDAHEITTKFHIRLFLLEEDLFNERHNCFPTVEHDQDIYEYWFSIHGGDDVDGTSLAVSDDVYRSKVDELRDINGVPGLGKVGCMISSLERYAAKTKNFRSIANIKSLLQGLKTKPAAPSSKWADESQAGQLELYEAFEKVIEELKSFKEHSFPFLAKVNRREAPDYYDVIKSPMDLGTMARKLKSMQYRGKIEFARDLKLIWDNCLYYNSDPASIYRVHATEMMKRAETALKRVPEIQLGMSRKNEIVSTENSQTLNDYEEPDSDSDSSEGENPDENPADALSSMIRDETMEKDRPERHIFPSSEKVRIHADFPYKVMDEPELYRRKCDEFILNNWEAVAEISHRRSRMASGSVDPCNSEDVIFHSDASFASDFLNLQGFLPTIEIPSHNYSENCRPHTYNMHLIDIFHISDECRKLCEKLINNNSSHFKIGFMDDELFVPEVKRAASITIPLETLDHSLFQNSIQNIVCVYILNCGYESVKKSSVSCLSEVFSEFLALACKSAKLTHEQYGTSCNVEDFIYQLANIFGIFDISHLDETLSELEQQVENHISIKARLMHIYGRDDEPVDLTELVDGDPRFVTGNVFNEVCDDYLCLKSIGLGQHALSVEVCDYIENGTALSGSKKHKSDSKNDFSASIFADVKDSGDIIGLAMPFFSSKNRSEATLNPK